MGLGTLATRPKSHGHGLTLNTVLPGSNFTVLVPLLPELSAKIDRY